VKISEPVAVRAIRRLGAARANMAVIAVAYGVFAVSLLAQPARWGLTPAYHDLLEIMPQDVWGVMFTVVSVLLAAGAYLHRRRGFRWLPVTALSAALAITTCWCAGFVVRWATSPDTTPETWVSWAIFDFILLRALALLDYEEVRVPAPSRPDRTPDG
jgi:hypothetical protein